MKVILLGTFLILSLIDLSSSSIISRIGDTCYIARFDKTFQPGERWCEASICGMCAGRFNCQVTCTPTVCEQRVDGKEYCKSHMEYLQSHHFDLSVSLMGTKLEVE
ncbi:hypothetical protein ACHWQZ_G015582 [Mnemiopsis leidyi]